MKLQELIRKCDFDKMFEYIVKFDSKSEGCRFAYLVAYELRITGAVLLIIFKSLISLCYITCLIRISLNLKNDQKNRLDDEIHHIITGHANNRSPKKCTIHKILPIMHQKQARYVKILSVKR